jgi:hypothetical protein
MQTAKYRVFLDGKSIDRSGLDRIETIVVQQQMDQAWQASLDLLVCTTERGVWQEEDDALIQPFKRLRIEVAVDDKNTWVPLIDGPVVGYDSELSPEPSQSTITVRASDDSVFLWRTDDPKRWEGSDSKIAKDIFKASKAVADTRIDDIDASANDGVQAVMQRGSLIETLHELASRHPGVHAWVAAGDKPGKSLGMFKKEDTAPGGLPALVLLGAGRNMDSFSGNADQQRPANVTGWALDLTDLSTKQATVKYNAVLVSTDKAAVDQKNVAVLVVPPGYAYGIDPKEIAERFAREYGETFDASGVVRSRCYAGVLQPYRVVEVKGVNGRLSGNYLIRSVTHTLTRSEYRQEFSLVRRGQSGGSNAPNPNKPKGKVS